MIDASDIMAALTEHGVTLVSGVPCSYLTPLLNQAISDPRVHYLPATQEGEAAAIAAGAWLGGGLGCVFSQNSGLGNIVNPLTSLFDPAEIPALLLVTWRGEPGRKDEPQHKLMGQITAPLLDLLEVPWDLLPSDPALVPGVLAGAFSRLQAHRRPSAVIVRKNVVSPAGLEQTPVRPRETVVTRSPLAPERPARMTVLAELLATAPTGTAIVSTTGYTSRELYTLEDRAANFYLVGAMGSAGPVGLGVATQAKQPVIVIDGDGALLMRLGSLATIGAYAPPGLVHVVLDNGQHESTGGQGTVSPATDLTAAAAACGYARSYACSTTEELTAAVGESLTGAGPALVHLPIKAGSPSGLGRPTITPAEVAERFRDFVSASATRQAAEALR